jgi:chromosome partitioning protein
VTETAVPNVRIKKLPPLPKPVNTRIIAVANQKGGVGKTTTTVNLAAAMALSGLHVLVVDVDPQGNASTALAIEHHVGTPDVYAVMVEGQSFGSIVKECPELI